MWPPQTSSISVIWELVRNANSQSYPRSIESDTFHLKPSNLGFNKPIWQFWYMLKFVNHSTRSRAHSVVHQLIQAFIPYPLYIQHTKNGARTQKTVEQELIKLTILKKREEKPNHQRHILAVFKKKNVGLPWRSRG